MHPGTSFSASQRIGILGILKNELKKSAHHYRKSRQRDVILEELRRIQKHLSADEVYALVRQKLPRISLGTVYRNLEVLTEMGEIQTLELGGSVKRYDWEPNKHYHIRCMQCGLVEDAPIAPLQQVEDELYGATVFNIIGHRLEFEGLCPACSRKAAARLAAQS